MKRKKSRAHLYLAYLFGYFIKAIRLLSKALKTKILGLTYMIY